MINVEKKDMTVKEFRKLANSRRYAAPEKHKDNYKELERCFW